MSKSKRQVKKQAALQVKNSLVLTPNQVDILRDPRKLATMAMLYVMDRQDLYGHNSADFLDINVCHFTNTQYHEDKVNVNINGTGPKYKYPELGETCENIQEVQELWNLINNK